MKNILLLSAFILTIGSYSCSSAKQAESGSDDVYMNRTESAPPVKSYTETQPNADDQSQQNYSNQNEEHQNSSPDYSTSEKYTDTDGTTYITNNYYNNDNNDGGYYSSQLNRWYNPYMGFGYYSPCYSGFNYYDPFYFSPGLSFSLGFGFGFGNSFFNYYDPFYSPWYSPWYSPYYSWGYPYYGGYNPYWGGYGGYGYGYGDGGWNNGYGYGGGGSNNNYYGYHGSSSSNSASDDGGRHYKSGDGGSGNTGQQGGYNGTISNHGLIQNTKGRSVENINQGDNQNLSGKSKGNPGVINGNNEGKDLRPQPQNERINNDRNANQPDRNLNQPERNNSAPERNTIQERNAGPAQNGNNRNPRMANLSQPLGRSSLPHTDYNGQHSMNSKPEWTMNGQRMPPPQNYSYSNHQPGNDQKRIQQNAPDKKQYSSRNAEKHSYEAPPQREQSGHEQRQAAPQQHSDGGSHGNYSSGNSYHSSGRSNGGGSRNPR